MPREKEKVFLDQTQSRELRRGAEGGGWEAGRRRQAAGSPQPALRPSPAPPRHGPVGAVKGGQCGEAVRLGAEDHTVTMESVYRCEGEKSSF